LERFEQMVIRNGMKLFRHAIQPDHDALFKDADLFQRRQLASHAGESGVQLCKQIVSVGLREGLKSETAIVPPTQG
jgi:hypothetical protein